MVILEHAVVVEPGIAVIANKSWLFANLVQTFFVNFQIAFGSKFFVAQEAVNIIGYVFGCFHSVG
jgi:hypothetical protein